MEIVILTGMSGAGKSLAANYLEDIGYFCIDNLPPQLLSELIIAFTRTHETIDEDENSNRSKLALVMDVRSSYLFSGLAPALRELKQQNIPYRIIFLEASDRSLISRYKQSRRNHPLAERHSLAEAISEERVRLAPIRELATDIVNTTGLKPNNLRDKLFNLLADDEADVELRMSILIQTFGFKYGLPLDCDNVLDVRFIPNPFYIETLRPLSGLDGPVHEHVVQFEETRTFLEKQIDFYAFVLPLYVREGKVRLSIGVGCTGGRHRSVVMAELLAKAIREMGYHVIVDHRDLERDPMGQVAEGTSLV